MTSKYITRLGAYPQLAMKAPVSTVSVVNIVLTGHQTIDDVTTTDNMRVLLTNQSIATDSGIWIANSKAWTRAPDWNQDQDVTNGVVIMSSNRGAGFRASFTGTFILGTTEVTFPSVFGVVSIATTDRSNFNPGYTLTRVSDNSFTLDGVDVTHLYYVNRRLRITGIDGSSVYGAIATSVFGTDTTITMTMEGGAVIPNPMIAAVLTTNDVQWAPVAINNHQFPSMNNARIISGTIGIDVWWVIVGEGGYISTSRDLAATFQTRTITGGLTIENINDVAYDSDNQRFMAVADDTWMITSVDGINWVSSQPSDLTTLVTSGSGHIDHIAYGWTLAGGTPGFVIYMYSASAVNRSVYTTVDLGVNWDDIGVENGSVIRRFEYNPNNNRFFICSFNGLSVAPGTWVTTNENSGLQSNDIDFLTSPNNAFAACAVDGQDGQIVAISSGGTAGAAELAPTGLIDPDNALCVATSQLLVGAAYGGDNGKIVYYDNAAGTASSISNGFNPTSKVIDMHYDETDAIFVAISNDGNICRSVNGIN
jgi:hypothetical protein